DPRHEKKRFRIAGDKKESRRMRGDERCDEKTQCGREVPSLTKEKKIAPKAPRGCLRSNKERVFRSDVKAITDQSRQSRISREKRNVGNFHYLVINRRDDRLITAIDDVQEPIAVVLD